MGGGALALHDIDTYVPTDEPFDLDAMLVSAQSEPTTLFSARIKDSVAMHDEGPLPATIMRGGYANCVARLWFDYHDVDDMFVHRADVRGLATPALHAVIDGKARAHRFKDAAGFIKAQVVAHAEEQPVVDSPRWQVVVTDAIKRMQSSASPAKIRRYEAHRWIGELVDQQFDHPALRALYRRAERERSLSRA